MTDIKRDRWGRPLIIPDGGGDPVAYTRASTLAKKLDDMNGLIKWKQAMTAIGVVKDREAQNRIASMLHADPEPFKTRKGELNEAVERAFLAGGGDRAASSGTSIHEFTEQIDAGNPPPPELVPPEWGGLVDAYIWSTADLEPLDAEMFVVVDELKVAGSFDRLWRLPDGRVLIGDLKTGAHDPKYPSGVTTQIAIYSRGRRYDPDTGERSPIHPDLDTSTGLLVHLPLIDAGEPHCDLYELGLQAGWDRAVLSAQVRDAAKIPRPKKVTK